MKYEKGISVIIPAHNCARTLKRAINSINYHNKDKLEIIIVENGSTDDTLTTAEELCTSSNNIIVTSSKKGVSNARNRGLEVASKDKIVFLDADDYFEDGAFNTLLNQQSGDLAIYSYKTGENNQRLFTAVKCYSGNELTLLIGRMLTYPTTFLTVWGKVFDAQVIRENRLKFRADLRLSEDSFFLIQYLYYCKSVFGYNDCIYNYSRNENSTVRNYNVNAVDEYLTSLQAVHDFVFKQFFVVKDYYYKYGLMQLNLIGVHGIFDRCNSQSFGNKVKRLKRVLNTSLIRECLTQVRIFQLRSPKFLAIILLKCHLTSLAGVVFMLRNRISF